MTTNNRHVAVIYIALCTFAFLIYAAPSSVTPLGSISKVREAGGREGGKEAELREGLTGRPTGWLIQGCWAGLARHECAGSGLVALSLRDSTQLEAWWCQLGWMLRVAYRLCGVLSH